MAIDGSRSTFPTTVDSFQEMYDLSPSEIVSAQRWQTLKLQATKTETEITEFNTLTTQLSSKIFSAESLNKILDVQYALEVFFRDNVQGYITAKQTEFQAEIDKFTDLGTFNPITQYYKKNFVDYNGEVFLCILNSLGNTPNPNATTTYWKKLSIKGETGYGVGLSPKGTFSSSTTYYVNDLVQYNGNLYRCILQSVSNYPTNEIYFELFLAGNGETLANLTTTEKTSLVGAINEVDADIANINIESTGYGVISGLTVSAQLTPDMTVNVATGTVHMANGVRYVPTASPTLAITTADVTKPRTDIVYINNTGIISYLASALGTAAIAGSETYTITTNAVGVIAGSETYTITTNAVATDTVVINGITFTAVASGATGDQFNVGADITITATNLTTVLNANTTINALYTATSSTDVITLTEIIAGGGNTPTTATYTGTIVITNGTIVTSKATDTVAINGITFSAIASGATGNQFNIGIDTTVTATNLTTTLNANATINALYTATSSTNIITLTEKIAGGLNTPTISTNTGTIVITNGTIVTSAVAIYPSPPTTPSGGFLLSEIAVGAGVTSIISANITDKRKIKNTTDSNADQITVLSGTGGIVEKANKSDLDTTNSTVTTHLTNYATYQETITAEFQKTIIRQYMGV